MRTDVRPFFVPEQIPPTVLITSMDFRIIPTVLEEMANVFCLNPGEYYFHAAKGSLNSFIRGEENFQFDCLKLIEQLLNKGVTTFILAPNTDCLGDLHRKFADEEGDITWQEEKITNVANFILQRAKHLNREVKVHGFTLALAKKCIIPWSLPQPEEDSVEISEKVIKARSTIPRKSSQAQARA